MNEYSQTEASQPTDVRGQGPSVRTYGWILGALLVLLVLTAVAPLLPLGPFALVMAMMIAVTKAWLVAGVFMHLRYEGGVVRLFAGAGLFWLAILVALTLADFMTRAA